MQGTSQGQSTEWYVDSGCSRHMTWNYSLLHDFKPYNGETVAFGDNTVGGTISGQGTVTNGKVSLNKVNFVKQLGFNLLSVSQVCDQTFDVLFTNKNCYILAPGAVKLRDEDVILTAPRNNDIYILDMENVQTSETSTTLISKASTSDSTLWH